MSRHAQDVRPIAVETTIYERWLAADVFAPDGRGSRADATKPPFVIIQPPPERDRAPCTWGTPSGRPWRTR